MPNYFAYGSNLDQRQIIERCSSSIFICKATLLGYRLAFTRFSKRRQCAVADVIPYDGEIVWGVIYDINQKDLEKLDKF